MLANMTIKNNVHAQGGLTNNYRLLNSYILQLLINFFEFISNISYFHRCFSKTILTAFFVSC